MRYLCNVHGRVSARAERVQPNVFWEGKDYGCTNPSCLSLEDRDGVRSTDGADIHESVVVVADWSIRLGSLFPHAEEILTPARTGKATSDSDLK